VQVADALAQLVQQTGCHQWRMIGTRGSARLVVHGASLRMQRLASITPNGDVAGRLVQRCPGMLPAASDGVTGYASSAGFDGVFTGGKPCKTEKNFNPGEDLRSLVRKLIRSIMVVTPARRDVDITLGL
jgi:hypothetical protein